MHAHFCKSHVLVIVAVLGMLVATSASASAQPLKRGGEFPSFSEPDLRTGETIKLEDFRGKVVLVDFWATWCGPCVAELPTVKKVFDKYHDKGFEIIGISLDSSTSKCKSFIEQKKMDWHHIADGKGWDAKLAKRHGINSIPRAVVVGRDGKIISVNAHGGELERAVKEGLGQDYAGGGAETDDQIDLKAKRQLAQADKLMAEKRFAEALNLYEEIGTKYAARPTGQFANERVRNLREDAAFMQKVQESKKSTYERQAQKEAGDWLRRARQMAKLDKPDLARKYYSKIIDKYPDSSLAETAREEMEKLPA